MRAWLRRRLLAAAAGVPALAVARPRVLRAQDDKPFSPFITSPPVTVLRMLSLAKVGAGDHVIDPRLRGRSHPDRRGG